MEPNRHMDIKRVVGNGNPRNVRHSVSDIPKPFRTLEIVAVTLAVVLVGIFLYFRPSLPAGGQQAGVNIEISSPATYTEPMTLKSEGKTFSISALGANPVQAVTTGNVTTYVDAFTNTDVTETKQSDRMKEDIILKQPGHPATFTYQIDVAPYDVVKDAQGNLVFYMKGHSGESNFWRFEIPAPFMIDAKGKKSTVQDVESTLTSDGILSVIPSAAWLVTAVYPVDLDPTIIFFRAGIAPAPPAPDTTTYIEDVFSAYTYTGNGRTQTITNGIDLAGKGGLVWGKVRDTALEHQLDNTEGGAGYSSHTNGDTGYEYLSTSLTSFNSDGFSVGNSLTRNYNGHTFVSWSFAQAPKFFKVAQVTVSGGVDATVDLSSLGTVGMVTVKRTDSTSAWYTWHRSLTAGNLVYLNTTAAQTADTSISVSGTTLTLKGGTIANGTYIVYAWAHDTSSTGLIQCGTFTGNGSLNVTTLGWEPQYLLTKRIDSVGGNMLWDTIRGWDVTGFHNILYSNLSDAENGAGGSLIPLATGFQQTMHTAGSPGIYIYCAIRRGPMKQATSGTQVYASKNSGTTGPLLTGWPVDLDWIWVDGYSMYFRDRLRGGANTIFSATTAAESSTADMGFDSNNGVKYVTTSYKQWDFRRYPGVFDMVAYTGTGSNQSVNHNLGVVPELILVKNRSNAGGVAFYAWASGMTSYAYSCRVDNGASQNSGNGSMTSLPTTSQLNLSTGVGWNGSSDTYVAYLFATKAGISKVGSYTGNGTSQTLNAGFTGGAKFVMIKRTDSTGDWYVWDSTRGIVAGNDPHLSLNTTAAEVTTDDSIDPDNSGFIVNQVAATNINVNAATYIYLAFSGDTVSTPYVPPTRTVPTIFRSKQTVVTPAVGQQAYTTPGSYSWTAPAGVTSVSVVAVGGGGGGDSSNGSGSGGGLGYKNNIAVVPGASYSVVVGTGRGGTADGDDSYFIDVTTVKGGKGLGSGRGNSSYAGDGGGIGIGGGYQGGGGAGGYSGNGGQGASNNYNPGISGTGGGGGGGGSSDGINHGGPGGGVGILGEGSNGSGGSGGSDSAGGAGSGGSGQNYGGGGYMPNGSGASGAVRIIWGPNRSFPSTNTADQTSVGGVLSTATPTIFRIPFVTGQQVYTAAQSTTWTAPAGVRSVSVVAIGGGGGADAGAGGGGGGLGYRNGISVTPGNTYTVVVGAAGASNPGGNGGDSYFIDTATVKGGGGQHTGASGPGGTYIGNGGGNGGAGYWAGGGAGGYAGTGGTANGSTGVEPTANGGGAGAGYSGGTDPGGGAGTGIYGLGATGVNGVNGVSAATGGSGGTNGEGSNGGEFGGGASQNYGGGGTARQGAIRIIWPGNLRQFPSTRTADE